MYNKDMCSHCSSADNAVDVTGTKVLECGREVAYKICTACCQHVRYLNFHRETEKIHDFWEQVWTNLEIEESVAA